MDGSEITNWLNKNQGVLALTGIATAALVSYKIYWAQRKKKQLEYVVVSSEPVLPPRISGELKVTYNKKSVPNACVSTIRTVNTGNAPILKEDFYSDLTYHLHGVNKAVAAIPTKVRPKDLQLGAHIDNNKVSIQPLLINPGDMVELHILTSGNIDYVSVEGRIAGTKFIHRKDLPYSPGSGPEGELHGFDKFMWYVLPPIVFGSYLIYFVLASENLTAFVKTTIVAAILLWVFILNPKFVKRLDNRRGCWR